MPAWNGLSKKSEHKVMHKNVDACKFLQLFCKVSYMWSELIADNKPHCVHTDFDTQVVEKSNQIPTIGFTSIGQEGMMLLVWTKISIADDYKPKQKKQKKGLSKVYDKSFEHYFLYMPWGILLLI